jgi:hypothetical protein
MFLLLGTFLPPEADKNLEIIDYERGYDEVIIVCLHFLWFLLFMIFVNVE